MFSNIRCGITVVEVFNNISTQLNNYKKQFFRLSRKMPRTSIWLFFLSSCDFARHNLEAIVTTVVIYVESVA